MIKSFTIFGKEFPFYGMLFGFGLLVGGLLGIFRAKKYKIDWYDALCGAVYAGLGAILGAKVLFIITSLPSLIPALISGKITILQAITNGFVFYGGLLGGVLGLFIYCKQYKLDFVSYASIFAPSVPFGHMFGRIGCFLSGCCYGIIYDGPLAFTYPVEIIGYDDLGNALCYEPFEGNPRLPIQLIEASFLFVLWITTEIMFYKSKKKGLPLYTYAISYAVARFIFECFRGDAIRGKIWILSTSQIISLGILIFVGYVLIKNYIINYKQKKGIADSPINNNDNKVE